MRLRLLGAVGAIALLAAVACSDNDGSSRSAGDLTRDDLPILVLPQEALGDMAQGLAIDPESGYDENDEHAEDSLDPGDTGESVTEAGRIVGYGLNFLTGDPGAILGEGEGIIQAGSSVELYNSAGQASAMLKERVATFEEYAGETVEGVELVSVEVLSGTGAGDESGGLAFEAAVPGAGSIYSSLLFLRVGPLIGTVQVQAADDSDRSATLESVQDALEARIKAFLDGDLDDATPVAVPEETSRGLDAASAALTLEDLPEGFTVTNETYEDGTSDFTRSFESANTLTTAIGDSEVLTIENNVILFGSQIEASAFMGVVVSLLTGDGGAAFFGGILEAEGVEGEVQLEAREIAAGEEGHAIEGTVDMGFATVNVAFLMARSGPGVSALIVTGAPDGFNGDDMLPLLELSLDRVAELLASVQ